MEASIQCRNMVEQQIRTWEVLDDRVLDLYYELDRADFTPAQHAGLAYADTQVPLAKRQTMLEPKVEARLLQELAPQLNETVLHIGTGSGFFAALLSKLCARMTTVEIIPELADSARKQLDRHGISNCTVTTGDGLDLPAGADSYNAIVLTGSVPQPPTGLFEQLADDGRLVAAIGCVPTGSVMRFRRTGGGGVSEYLFDTSIAPLSGGALAAPKFDF